LYEELVGISSLVGAMMNTLEAIDVTLSLKGLVFSLIEVSPETINRKGYVRKRGFSGNAHIPQNI
jgi:hypothetical protein